MNYSQVSVKESLEKLLIESHSDLPSQKYLLIAAGTLNWSRLRLVKCLLNSNTSNIDAIQLLPWRDHIDGYFHNLKCLMGANHWDFKSTTLFTWKYPILVLSKGALNGLCGYLAKDEDPAKYLRIVMV